ncbi:hypothetical protein ACYZTM_14515 [Pseudomonas sp. MDT2-39-1]
MERQDFRLAQNALSLEIDEQLLDAIQLDDIASQTGNAHGHTAHAVTSSSDLVFFRKLTDLACNTDSSCLGHRKALYLLSNHSRAPAYCPRWLIANHQVKGVPSIPPIARKDAAYGFATMQAKNKQLAFMTGIQDKSIQIKGNPALVIWFQGLTKYLKPRKAKAKAKA